jgi:hypothetical protein
MFQVILVKKMCCGTVPMVNNHNQSSNNEEPPNSRKTEAQRRRFPNNARERYLEHRRFNNNTLKFQKRRFTDPITLKVKRLADAVVLNKKPYHPKSLLRWMQNSPNWESPKIPHSQRRMDDNNLSKILLSELALEGIGPVSLHTLLLPDFSKQLISDLKTIKKFYEESGVLKFLKDNAYRSISPSSLPLSLKTLFGAVNPARTALIKARGRGASIKYYFLPIRNQDIPRDVAVDASMSKIRALVSKLHDHERLSLAVDIIRPSYGLSTIANYKGEIQTVFFSFDGIDIHYSKTLGWTVDSFGSVWGRGPFLASRRTELTYAKHHIVDHFRFAYETVLGKSNSRNATSNNTPMFPAFRTPKNGMYI